MKMRVILLVGISLIVVYFSVSSLYSRRTRVMSTWEKGLIKSYGSYKTKDGNITIAVSKIPNTLLYYIARDKKGNVLFSSDQAIEVSVFHRWGLFWDEKNDYFWVCSRDVGDSVWVKDANGKYQVHGVWESEYMKMIPEPLFSTLLKSTQEDYKREIKESSPK